jgi:hypothetical protein
MNSEKEIRLAPPGAGLPKVELLVARWLFQWRRARGSRQSFTEAFQRERGRIRLSIGDLSPDACAQRVLIPRLRGLEDSSRYWSVWMTLDHLRIVHRSIN